MCPLSCDFSDTMLFVYSATLFTYMMQAEEHVFSGFLPFFLFVTSVDIRFIRSLA